MAEAETKNKKGAVGGPRWLGALFGRSERRIAEVFVTAIGGSRSALIAILVEQLQAVALPNRLSQVVDHVEDGEGLFGRPIGWDLERDGKRQAFRRFGHDFVLRRFWARCSDRSRASLRR